MAEDEFEAQEAWSQTHTHTERNRHTHVHRHTNRIPHKGQALSLRHENRKEDVFTWDSNETPSKVSYSPYELDIIPTEAKRQARSLSLRTNPPHTDTHTHTHTHTLTHMRSHTHTDMYTQTAWLRLLGS